MTQTTERSAVPPTGPAPDADFEALAALESAGSPPEPVPAASADAGAQDDPIEAAPGPADAPEDPVIDGLDAADQDGAEGSGDVSHEAAGQEPGQESSQQLHQGPDPEPDPDAPLLDGDLEQGIATIFAALHSATDGASWPDAGTPAADDRHTGAFAWLGEDDDVVDVEAVDLSTFRLLGELDRLWHRAA